MKTLIRFVNIVLIAILAGVSLGISVGFNPARLTAGAYIAQQQNMLQLLTVPMISLVIITTAVTLVNAYIHRRVPLFLWMLVGAAICLVGCMVITKFGNVPIDQQVMSWTLDDMPGDWQKIRDRWSSLHAMRVATELIALCLIAYTSVKASRRAGDDLTI